MLRCLLNAITVLSVPLWAAVIVLFRITNPQADLEPGCYSIPIPRDLWTARKLGTRFLGFAVYRPRSGTGGSFYEVPIWVVVLAFAVMPVLGLKRIAGRRRSLKRIAAAQCSTCGYDLRATPDRCPECGTPIPAEVKA